MNQLLNMLIASARAKIMPLWIKLRMWSSPAFLKSQVLVRIREFFTKLLDVKPRNKWDYYSLFRWQVSKRLAFAIVVALGLVASLYIALTLPKDFLKGDGNAIPTYQYRSIPLKFYSGKVRILAREGYVAYGGNVDGGAASGDGVLYAADGSKVYEGQFANSMYNGTGTRYYPNGLPRYIGSFTDNVYNGTGSAYRDNGTLEYTGGFVDGLRSGVGILHDSVGAPVFNGNFQNGEIAYADFLGRPTGEIAGMYSGETEVYQSGDEYCVVMRDIDGVYSVKDGSNTLENEWTVDRLYVLRDTVMLEGSTCTSIRQLQNILGEPLYYGAAWVNLPEAAAWNVLAAQDPDEIEAVEITAQEGLEGVYSVTEYDRDFQMYLYTFEKAGVLYTFYFNAAGESDFVMYAMEKA